MHRQSGLEAALCRPWPWLPGPAACSPVGLPVQRKAGPPSNAATRPRATAAKGSSVRPGEPGRLAMPAQRTRLLPGKQPRPITAETVLSRASNGARPVPLLLSAVMRSLRLALNWGITRPPSVGVRRCPAAQRMSALKVCSFPVERRAPKAQLSWYACDTNRM